MKDNYRIRNVEDAKTVATAYLTTLGLANVIEFGLPEIDDRYDIWRVPLLSAENIRIGEIVIDAITSFVDKSKTTRRTLLEDRLLKRETISPKPIKKHSVPKLSALRNTVGLGDSEQLLKDFPSECVDLVFTSPPYYNARPEYMEYLSYESYLLKMRKIIHECARVLNEGRFFVLNVSPILIRRASRSEASKRIALPFDFHHLFMQEGFEFIDDIIWVKPEGAGWASGRGRRFSADRNPMQYKPVPVTEYVLVYRKKTDKLIDWLIRKHPDQEAVKQSKIADGYEVTNLWKICPAHKKNHPAVFPLELASKVISYYSFVGDVILDPFGGSGTTAFAAAALNRRFAILEKESSYVQEFKEQITQEYSLFNLDINWINV